MKIKIYNQNIWGNYAQNECIGNRNELIRDLIYEYGADVCGFQECNPATSRAQDVDIAKLLQEDYVEVPTVAEKYNFTPIFYRKDKFELIEAGWEKYTGKNDLGSKSSTWCVLEEKTSKIRIAYVSTHFWWAFNSEDDDQQRLKNVDQLYALLQWIKNQFQVPVIVAGDFNSGENSIQGSAPIEKMQEKGLIKLAEIAKKKEGHFTVHSYPVRNNNHVYYGESQPDYILDHAFMLQEERLEIEEFLVDTSVKALSSSDHCPLKIEVII